MDRDVSLSGLFIYHMASLIPYLQMIDGNFPIFYYTFEVFFYERLGSYFHIL